MKTITLKKSGLEKLLENYMYRIFVVHGRDIQFEEVCEVLNDIEIDVPKEIIQDVFDFTQDLYDENEKNGWNDEAYPNRKKPDGQLSPDEFQRFNRVIDEVLLPFIHKNKDELNILIDRDPEFKSRVESKVERILNARKK